MSTYLNPRVVLAALNAAMDPEVGTGKPRWPTASVMRVRLKKLRDHVRQYVETEAVEICIVEYQTAFTKDQILDRRCVLAAGHERTHVMVSGKEWPVWVSDGT